MSVFRSAVQQITRAVSNKPQGIELAKSVDSKVGDTQKDAANKIKGPTTLEIAAK
jgi:hypothetical protein